MFSRFLFPPKERPAHAQGWGLLPVFHRGRPDQLPVRLHRPRHLPHQGPLRVAAGSPRPEPWGPRPGGKGGAGGPGSPAAGEAAQPPLSPRPAGQRRGRPQRVQLVIRGQSLGRQRQQPAHAVARAVLVFGQHIAGGPWAGRRPGPWGSHAGDELGSLLSLPAAGAPEPGLCACPPGVSEYQVPAAPRPHYDTPRSLRQAPRDQPPVAPGSPEGGTARDSGCTAGWPGERRRGPAPEAAAGAGESWEAGAPHAGPPPALFSACPICGGLKVKPPP